MMWPFKSSKIDLHIAEALAPGALPSAREKAMGALMALPQKPESLECYSKIALDARQVWKVRYKAMQGMQLSPDHGGARALLRCVGTDLRRPALSLLCGKGLPEALSQINTEATAILTEALDHISSDAKSKFNELLLSELDSLRKLLALAELPGAKDLQSKVEEVSFQMRDHLVPKFLERALTSKYHHDVKEALAELKKLDTAGSKTALEKFLGEKSRLVEKTVVPGVGAVEEDIKLQVYTSEFGQTPCEQELADRAALAKDWEERHPAVKSEPEPPPPADLPADNIPLTPNPQYYAAASRRGIDDELLALVDNQLDFLKSLHRKGSLAPLAASMDCNGEINGFALTTADTANKDKTVEDTIAFFQQQFCASAGKREIIACAVFLHGHHGPGTGALSLAPARTEAEADCLVALLDHSEGQSFACVIQYTKRTDGDWLYALPYYVPNQPVIFTDPVPSDSFLAPRFARRPVAASDQGTHAELMLLLESQFEILKKLHRDESCAPFAAWMEPSGEIHGAMIVEREVWENRNIETDTRDSIVFYPQGDRERTPTGAISFFIKKFRAAAQNEEIVASAIFYHGLFDPEMPLREVLPSEGDEVPNCITGHLDHRLGQSVSAVIQYSRNDGGWQYAPVSCYSTAPLIFNENREFDALHP